MPVIIFHSIKVFSALACPWLGSWPCLTLALIPPYPPTLPPPLPSPGPGPVPVQNPKDRRKILLDDKLKTLFTQPLNMFNMNKQLKKHVKSDNGAGTPRNLIHSTPPTLHYRVSKPGC